MAGVRWARSSYTSVLYYASLFGSRACRVAPNPKGVSPAPPLCGIASPRPRGARAGFALCCSRGRACPTQKDCRADSSLVRGCATPLTCASGGGILRTPEIADPMVCASQPKELGFCEFCCEVVDERGAGYQHELCVFKTKVRLAHECVADAILIACVSIDLDKSLL